MGGYKNVTYVYIYQADIYCESCGLAIRNRLAHAGRPAIDDDSDAWPQGPYSDGGGEADTPQHCGTCHVFLRNPLTGDGVDYVRERAEFGVNDVIREWLEYYHIEV